jgi:hypothetical protein
MRTSSSVLLVLVIGCALSVISTQYGKRMYDDFSLIDLPRSFYIKNPTIAADPKSLLAYQQSYGFFDDISDEEWQILQHKVEKVYPNTRGNPYTDKLNSARAYFQNHFEPDFACRHERRVGALGDGGKWICDPHRLSPRSNTQLFPSTIANPSLVDVDVQPQTPSCLVYSIGSNGDPSFEIGVRDTIGPHCEIHIFDFDHFPWLEGMNHGGTFHQWGLTNNVSETTAGPGEIGKRIFKTLTQTLEELGHIGRPIDIFKIDCEKCEKQIYTEFFLPGIDLRQILVEVHSHDGLVPSVPDFMIALQDNGYVIFHKEFNIEYSENAIEYSFLKLHPDFFQGINRSSGWTNYQHLR